MKNFKRIQAMFLAVVMAIMTFGTTTVFAAEAIPNGENEIQSSEYASMEDVSTKTSTTLLSSRRTIDNGLIVNGGARGNNFGVFSNQIKFQINFYDGNKGYGHLPSAGSVILAIRLYDNTAGNVLVQEWQSSTGYMGATFNTTPNHTYHFEYLIAYGNIPVIAYMYVE